VEHELTITPFVPGYEPVDEPIHVMAQIDLASFEDDGYPESITGTLLDVPELLIAGASSLANFVVDLGGKAYRFVNLDKDGTFKLNVG